MENNQKIIAKIDNKIFNEKGFFEYLTDKERKEVLNDFEKNTSICVGFFFSGILRFAFILDFENYDTVHIREADGDFKKSYSILDKFVTGVAMGMNKNFLSLNTKKESLARFAKKCGWQEKQQNEFLKAV